MPQRLKLQGAMTALVTPFSNGGVDYIALGEIIDNQLAGGIQGLVPCGTTGESPTLDFDEHEKVIAFTIERAAGRVPLIAGTGSNSTAEALRLTRHAKEAGADACLVVNPYYNKPTQQGMYEHIARLAEVGLPIVLYNIPGRSAVELTPETILRMYEEIETVVAIKEATGGLDTASAVASMCDITILSGDDALTLPMASVGGSGVISVLGNLLPAEIRRLWDLIDQGDLRQATAQHLKLFPLCKAMFVQTNPIPIKAALHMVGLCNNDLRLPMTPLAASFRGQLADMLTQYGLTVTR